MTAAPKTARILIRASEDRKQAYRALADVNDLSLSAWIVRELDRSVHAAGVAVESVKRRKRG